MDKRLGRNGGIGDDDYGQHGESKFTTENELCRELGESQLG
jgi:hypothetical protein